MRNAGRVSCFVCLLAASLGLSDPAPGQSVKALPHAAPAPTATPRSVAGLGVVSHVETCLRNGQPQHFISTVNGRKGATFTPGGRYEIAGCGFGASPGRVYLGASAPGRGAFKIPLVVDSWGEQKVAAHIDDAQNSNPDVPRVTVNLQPAGAAESATIGSTDPQNAFETIKEVRWVRPSSGYAKVSPAWGMPSWGVDGSGERTLVNRKLKVGGFCPNINNTWPADEWNVSRLLDLGFKILEVDVVNLTDRTVGEDSNSQSVMAGGPGTGRFVPAARSVRVEWQGHSMYAKASVGVGDNKYSVCTSSYAIRLKVQGPRGVNPFP